MKISDKFSAPEMQATPHTCPNCGYDLRPKPQPLPASEATKASSSDPLLVPLAADIDRFAAHRTHDGKEQRRSKRLRANFKACIRFGNDEDVVEVLDISRTGVHFSSLKLYQPGMYVQVSAPYTIGGNNIFSSGRIVRAIRRPTKVLAGDYALELLPQTSF